MTREECILGIREEAEGLSDFGGFPLDIFPKKIRQIVSDMARNCGYIPDFLSAGIIAAASVAIGNSRRIRIRGNWSVNPMLYMVFVGRPGLGKTPPLNAAFKAIYDLDKRRHSQFLDELAAWEGTRKTDRTEPRPVYRQTIVSDFTPEALTNVHWHNPRGVVIVCDEISELFNSASRYNSSPFVTQMLTAWSGGQLRYNRVSQDFPMIISNPFIGVVGSMQTQVFNRFLKSGGCRENGFLDRLMVVYPTDTKVRRWSRDDDPEVSDKSQECLDGIMDKLLCLEYDSAHPICLEFSPDAKEALYAWNDCNIEANNNARSEMEVDSRLDKLVTHVARCSLILQGLAWACGEAEFGEVELSSVEAATRFSDYLQDCYHRLMEAVSEEPLPSDSTRMRELFELVGDSFSTADALAGASMLDIPERTAKRWLAQGVEQGRLAKVEHGRYAVKK